MIALRTKFYLLYKHLEYIGDIMTGAACGAGNSYPSETPDFTSGFYRSSRFMCLSCFVFVSILGFDCSSCLILVSMFLLFKKEFIVHVS